MENAKKRINKGLSRADQMLRRHKNEMCRYDPKDQGSRGQMGKFEKKSKQKISLFFLNAKINLANQPNAEYSKSIF